MEFKNLVKNFQDELCDSDMYYDLGVKCSADPITSKKAKGFYELSKDEFTHARFIKDILVFNGVEITPNDEEHYNKVKERTYSLFR